MDLVAIFGAFAALGVGALAAGGTGLAIALVVKAALDSQKKTRAEWDTAAAALGLRRVERVFPAVSAIEGQVDGLPVSVKGYGGKGARTVYQVGVPFTSLRLTREGITSAIGRLVSGEDVQTGDSVFDDKALLRGDAAELRALFDAETRAAALAVFALGGWVGDGKIKIQQNGLQRSGERIEASLRAQLHLAQRLAESDKTPAWKRLAAICIGDPLPQVRQNALASLIALEARTSPSRVADAVSHMLEDPAAENRLFAATCGHADVTRARRVIATLAWDPDTDDVTRASGLAALGTLDGVDRADELLDTLLDGGDHSRLAAVGALVRRGCAPSRVTKLATHAHGPTRVAVANALGVIGDSSVQPLLLSMLEDPAEQVRVAAVRALGEVADVGAVEKLLPLIPGFFGGDLKLAAEDAVSRIQSRASGAGAGQLSVSDAPPAAGALSAVVAEEGALSTADTSPRPAPRKTIA